MVRERFAGRPLALERLHGLCPRCRLLGRQFILGCCRFQLFELKLHLFQQPRLALRARAIELAPQLLDLELEMADERFRARQIRLGIGRFGTSIGEPGLRLNAGGALGKDQRMRSGKISGKQFAGGHADDGITSVTICKPKNVTPPTSVATSPADVSNRCRTEGNPVVPARSSPRHPLATATKSARVPNAS